MTCTHCKDAGKCNCIVCGQFVMVPSQGPQWVNGKCVSCAAIAFQRKHKKFLATFDPRDHRLWEHHAAADGNKGYRKYLPEVGLK